MSFNIQLDRPYFIISLDTELLWGPNNSNIVEMLRNNQKAVRESVLKILTLLEKHNIPATWAVVGHLFRDSCSKENCLTHKNIHTYNYKTEFYNDPYSNINEGPLYYGKDIVEKILSSSVSHEIGCHSYSHPNFTNISKEMAFDEVKEARKIAEEWDLELRSFVFPEDEPAHLDVLIENDFRIYRGKTQFPIPYDKKKSRIRRLPQTFIKKLIAVPVEPAWKDGIWEIPSSMYFSEPRPEWSVLLRARKGLKKAIKNDKVFHICLHPWNILLYDRLIDDINTFLKLVSKYREIDDLMVVTMGQLADILDSIKNL